MATKSKKTNTSKLNSKILWLKKRWMLVAVLVAFASVGTYIIGVSNAETKWFVSDLGYQCPSLPTLKSGSAGDCVKSLQVGLNNRNGNLKLMKGTAWTPLVVDGKYGQATYSAVKRFQTDYSTSGKKLAVDGMVGPATWDRFLNDCLVFSDLRWIGTVDGKSGTTIKPGYACGN